MADQMDGKGRPPKRRSGLTRGQKGLIAAAAVLAVALAGVLAWQSLFVRPDLNTGKTEPQETEEPTDPVEEIDWGEGTRPRSDGERKSQDYYTVLILGRDTGGGGNTDTMLLASYDVTNQKATVMSIPRDTMVNVSWDIKKINSVYNTYGGGDRGIQALYKEISQLVGFEPDYQVIVEWEAVGEIVDAMGGVWFDVPRNMNYDDPLQNLHIHQEKGYRLLTGEDAMEVLRGIPGGRRGPHQDPAGVFEGDGRATAESGKCAESPAVHSGISGQCGDKPDVSKHPLVCAGRIFRWPEGGERGIRHHAG